MTDWSVTDCEVALVVEFIIVVINNICCYKVWNPMRLAHEVPSVGHLGTGRGTQEKILKHFYWPKIHQDVVEFCNTCHTKPNHPPPAPLKPFEGMINCVGSLSKKRKGNQYLFTVMDLSTRYPEAFPLCNITAKTLCWRHCFFFYSRDGLPKLVQSH